MCSRFCLILIPFIVLSVSGMDQSDRVGRLRKAALATAYYAPAPGSEAQEREELLAMFDRMRQLRFEQSMGIGKVTYKNT